MFVYDVTKHVAGIFQQPKFQKEQISFVLYGHVNVLLFWLLELIEKIGLTNFLLL